MPVSIDVSSCAREPIHVLGAIQPFGFLIAVSADWMVARVSSNTSEFLKRTPNELLGRPLTDVFTEHAVPALRNMVAMLRGVDAVERGFGVTLTADGVAYDVAVHFSDKSLVIEAEPASVQSRDTTALVRRMASRVGQTQNLQPFLQEAARQVRAVTGFDRVMVYRFDAAGSGEVIAEARAAHVDSFLGLNYPASDIPGQARKLYIRNLFRIIADVDATPVQIMPQFDGKGAPLGLSLSVLRSVSPIHIEYLRNMGVAASLSISIVVEGRLWGLFVCHHYEPRLPDFAERTTAELFGYMFSLMLEGRQRALVAAYEDRARAVSDRLMSVVAQDGSRLSDAEWLSSVMADAIPCDGVGVYADGVISLSGLTPNENEFRGIVSVFNRNAASEIFTTDCIAKLIPEATDYAFRASGLLAIPISRTPRDYLVLFRPEKIRSVRWAGNPEKPATSGPNGARLTPRKSFEEWSELVKHTATTFTQSELRIAETVRGTLLEVVLRLADEAAVERRKADERQTLLIAELNHRVRNILALIRSLLNQTRTKDHPVEEVMATLGDRVLALARAHDQITADRWAPAPLRVLIETEVAAFLGPKSARVHLVGEEVSLDPQAFTVVALVIHELVTNASKYGALSDAGAVHIEWRMLGSGALCLQWREKDGPPVKPPQRQGFGTTIIERSISHDLNGRAEVRYMLQGLEVDFEIPARHVSAQDVSTLKAFEAPAETGIDVTPLDSKMTLLLEDNLMIALDCEAFLRSLGAADVLVAASLKTALSLAADPRIAFAVLDLNLGAETSLPVADALAARGVPFIFATGYGGSAFSDGIHAGRIAVSKPYSLGDLRRACAQALS